MKENIEEDIEVMANIIIHYIEADKCGLSNNDFKCEIQALSNILSDYKRVLKENEILKEEKEQAWEEWNSLEQGSYEIEQKLKQQLKKLQKENEELKADNYELNNRINDLLDSIPVQKVKDKIEELKQEKKKYGNCLIEMYEDELVNRDIKILQELLEK